MTLTLVSGVIAAGCLALLVWGTAQRHGRALLALLAAALLVAGLAALPPKTPQVRVMAPATPSDLRGEPRHRPSGP